MRIDRKKLGKRSEDRAAEFLRDHGLRTVERNYRCPFGEIDLIAREGECLIFVEVRSSRTGTFAHPMYSIGLRKRRTLIRTALHYLKEKGLLNSRSRFDVVTVVEEGPEADIRWIKNAFEAAG